MVSLDELVLEMRDIMELAYIFEYEKEEQFLSVVHSLLKEKLQDFYRDCYLASSDVLKDSLFYVESLIKAYDGDGVLEEMSMALEEYVTIVKGDMYMCETSELIKK